MRAQLRQHDVTVISFFNGLHSMAEFIQNIGVHIKQYWIIYIMFIFIGLFVDINIGAFNFVFRVAEISVFIIIYSAAVRTIYGR